MKVEYVAFIVYCLDCSSSEDFDGQREKIQRKLTMLRDEVEPQNNKIENNEIDTGSEKSSNDTEDDSSDDNDDDLPIIGRKLLDMVLRKKHVLVVKV